jgi:DNA polymerase (family 10)
MAQMEDVISLLEEVRKLMELHGENPFKMRAFERAIETFSAHSDILERVARGTLTELPGIGQGIASIVTEFVQEGRSSVRDQLTQALPEGLLELIDIPSLGPKKAKQLIQELGLHSLSELEYACRENRLLKLKGFGAKLQQKILEGVLFKNANAGMQRLVDVEPVVAAILTQLRERLPHLRIHETGSLRRQSEVLDRLDFIIEFKEFKEFKEAKNDHDLQAVQENATATRMEIQKTYKNALPIHFHYAPASSFGWEWVRTTGTEFHLSALGVESRLESTLGAASESAFYKELGISWIPPEARETGEEVALARSGHLEDLLATDGIRGVFHNHTVYSDGNATLDQMVTEAERLGYEYIGISDHSKTAFYAHGLTEDLLIKQQNEVRQVQERHPGIHIFWGIESDILADGSLDYEPHILKEFDFVIASVHSRFNMDRDAMTQRILAAVRNPYTRFLGHPTGRLLLGRKPYAVDMSEIIAEATRQGVAIEINANPARLDLDWRWGAEMRKRKTWTSINPDAHELKGLQDVRHGVVVARKALLSKDQILNTRPLKEVKNWLKEIRRL